MNKNKRAEIKIEPLNLEDSTSRIEHQFEIAIARLDKILAYIENYIKTGE